MNFPKVGVGVFVIKNGKILVMKRKGAHGDGSWSLPGGHLEFGESFFDTAIREVKEETGLSVANPRFVCVTNDIFVEDQKHYITIFVATDYTSGHPQITEPDKCSELSWSEIDKLPRPLFTPLRNVIEDKCFPENWKDRLGS